MTAEETADGMERPRPATVPAAGEPAARLAEGTPEGAVLPLVDAWRIRAVRRLSGAEGMLALRALIGRPPVGP